jgi:hypothetical protein
MTLYPLLIYNCFLSYFLGCKNTIFFDSVGVSKKKCGKNIARVSVSRVLTVGGGIKTIGERTPTCKKKA